MGTITLHYLPETQDDSSDRLLMDCIRKFGQDCYAHTELHRGGRNRDGCLEYVAICTYPSGGEITIGCLQRTPTSNTEFHS